MVRGGPRRRSVGGIDAYDLLLGILVAALLIWGGASDRGRAGLASIGVLVLLWPGSPEPGTERRRTRQTVLLALASLALAVGPQAVRFVTSWDVRVWNVYHYYLGAKYFRELGYTDLYDATLQADREGQDYWHDIARVRNLVTYEVESRAAREGRFEPRVSFTPERWQDFRREVEALSGQRTSRGWRGIFVDRGYNASPLWTVVGSALAHLAPADRPLALKVLCSLDLLLLGATFGGLLSVFGARHASLVLLLLTIGPVNLDRFVGGFLQYDWFCAVAVAVCCYQRGRPVPAAGLMAYAVLTRIFPIFFVLAGLVPVAWSWWSDKRRPTRGLRFLVAFAAWCVLGLGVSLFNGRGVDGWREFAVNIATHREHHLFGERRVGLPFLFTHRLGSLDFDESTTDRQRTYEGQKTLAALGAAALTAGFLLSVRRLRPWRAQLLGLVPVFALLVTSRYYWSYLALLPLVAGRRAPPAKGSRWLGGAQLVVFAAFYVYDASNGDPYSAYFLLNLLILAYLVCSLAAIGSTGKAASTRAEDAPPIQHRSAPLGDHALDDKKARE